MANRCYTCGMPESAAPQEPLQVSIESGRILLKIVGPLTGQNVEPFAQAAQAAEEAIRAQSQGTGKKVRILFDLTAFDGSYEGRSMEALTTLAAHDAQYVEKTACFGGPVLARVAGDIIAALAHRENIKFFATKDEAIAWLG